MKRWLGRLPLRARLLRELLLWALLLGGYSGGAWAEEPQASQELARPMAMAKWRDPAGKARLEDMAEKPFEPFSSALSLGNSEDAVWIRLNLPPLAGQDGHWMLLLQPAMLQEATIFVQDTDGGWVHQRMGFAHAFARRPVATLNVAYPLKASSLPRLAYIRLKTVTSPFQVQLVPATQVYTLDAEMIGGIGLYAGLTLVFTLISLVFWWLTRDALWGLIGLFDAGTLVVLGGQLGLISRFLIPEAEGLMNHLFVLANCTHIAVVMVLSYHLARRFCSRRWVAWPYLLVLAAYPVELIFMLRGREAAALSMSNISVILMSFWALVASLMFDVEDRLLRWTCRALYWILGLYLLYYLTPLVIRIPPPAALHFYPALPSNFVTMVFASMMLLRSTQRARAAREEEQRRHQAERELMLSRRQHEETSGLLSMLLHEIRTPLALIQTATRAISGGRSADAAGLQKMTHRIDDAVLNISGVLERCIEVDSLEQDQFTPQPVALDAAAVLRDWLASRPAHHRVQLSAPEQLPACLDPQLWLSMVANLLQNALKYSPPESTIWLELAQQGSDVVLKVGNQVGQAGLPDPARLFQKFYRSDRATYVSGTGLGLYWVKVLSQRLGGDVSYLPPDEHLAPDWLSFSLALPEVRP